MKNTLKIYHNKRIIEMDRTFAKNAENTMSEEYQHLRSVRRDYPKYKDKVKTIKKIKKKKSYQGLDYPYMRWYIQKYDKMNGTSQLAVLEHKIDIAKCHKNGYPKIKSWFLEQYPEIAEFGMPEIDETFVVVNVPAINTISSERKEDQE